MGGLAEFFFNIVPGALILLFSNFLFGEQLALFRLQIHGSEGFKLAIFAIASLLIGFFLQLLTKKLKEEYLYNLIWSHVAKEQIYLYDKVRKYLEEKSLLDKKIKDANEEHKQIFFIMDNYLSFSGGGRLLPHFASRSAYWSNLGWTFVITGLQVLIALCFINTNVDTSILLLFLVFSICLSWISFSVFITHQKQHYEIVLKTFSSVVVIDHKANFSRQVPSKDSP